MASGSAARGLGPVRFRDRREAGRALAAELDAYAGRDDVVVLALPRGGVPVGYEVAKALGAPLGVIVARKLGVPGHEEQAMGAIARGAVVLDENLVRSLGLDRSTIERVAAAELHELGRREAAYLEGREQPDLEGKTVILVDDGLATGATMRAAALAVRQHSPARIVVAAPVGSEEACREFRDVVDDVVCVLMPKPLQAVGLWYDDFAQTSDEEVRTLLARASEGDGDAPAGARAPEGTETDVAIPVPGASLEGTLALPEEAFGIVVFAHGTGSSRHSPRNRMVASRLNQAGMGTLLVDLLTPAEEQVDRRSGRLRFDIDLLADRVAAAVDWVRREHPSLPVGLFGASTGAAAALVAAAERPDEVGAIVSRGGRPDLAGAVLREVAAPTLLIVGGADELVLELNRRALELLPGEKQLAVVPGATHLFEEPGALEEVARLAAEWFTRHLGDGDGGR